MTYKPYVEPQTSAFGEILAESLTPQVQAHAVYGIGNKVQSIVFGTGSATVANNLFTCQSGATAGSVGSILTKKAIGYRAGQGTVGRGTAMFTLGQTGAGGQVAGLLNGVDQLSFGYRPSGSAEFGIHYFYGGQHEFRLLTITVGAGVAGNVTVTLNSQAFVIAVTNSGSTAKTADEIAEGITAAIATTTWRAQAINGAVLCYNFFPAPNLGTFSFAPGATGAAGAFTTINSGVLQTRTFIPQSQWNGTPTPWHDPSKLNVYQIRMQYLGAGNIFFDIENPTTGKFDNVHQIRYANSATTTSVINPAFRWSWAVDNTGSAVNYTVKGASCLVGTHGTIASTEQSRSLTATKNLSTEQAVLSIENRFEFNAKANLSRIRMQLTSAFTDGTKGIIVKGYIGTALAGNYSFQYVDQNYSITTYDTAGTTVSGGRSVISFEAGNSGTTPIELEKYNIEILPGERFTLTAQVVSGAAANATVSLLFQEDL